MVKRNGKNRPKKTNQATKEYGDNIHSNPSYSDAAFASEILDLSEDTNSTPIETRQSDNNPESRSEKIEETSSNARNDLVADPNTNLAIEKKAYVPVPADEDERQQVMDTSLLLAAMSFWQSYTNTWIRAYSKLFMFGS